MFACCNSCFIHCTKSCGTAIKPLVVLTVYFLPAVLTVQFNTSTHVPSADTEVTLVIVGIWSIYFWLQHIQIKFVACMNKIYKQTYENNDPVRIPVLNFPTWNPLKSKSTSLMIILLNWFHHHIIFCSRSVDLDLLVNKTSWFSFLPYFKFK